MALRMLAAVAPLMVACGGSRAEAVSTPGVAGHLRITAVAPGYPERSDSSGRWLIYLDGFIDTGATARLGRLLARERIDEASVYFNSPGGHLVEAMALGRMLRQRGYDTSVGARAADGVQPRAGRCYSACPFAYAGGVRRSLEPGSTLGVHRAENRVPVPDESAFQQVVADQATGYLSEMGVSDDLLTIMSEAPHDRIRELTLEEAERLELLTPRALPQASPEDPFSRGADSP